MFVISSKAAILPYISTGYLPPFEKKNQNRVCFFRIPPDFVIYHYFILFDIDEDIDGNQIESQTIWIHHQNSSDCKIISESVLIYIQQRNNVLNFISLYNLFTILQKRN